MPLNLDPCLEPQTGAVSRQFDDLDVFAEALKPLTVDAIQLTPGQFLGTVNQAGFTGLKFTYINQNQAFRAMGPKSPRDLTFAMVVEPDKTQVISHGFPIQKWDLFGFDRNREIDMFVGENAKIILVNVDLSVFKSVADRIGCSELNSQFFQQNLLRFYPATLRNFRAYFLQVIHILNTQPLLLSQPPIQSSIVEDFLPLLIDTLNHLRGHKKLKTKTLHRYPLVKKAEEISRSYCDRPLTLRKLCDVLGTSSSALTYGFQEIFGMSPMAYLKVQRLNGVRHTLKNADPLATTVMQVAIQWGFSSPGHFSRDYKGMFGELPSETLIGGGSRERP